MIASFSCDHDNDLGNELPPDKMEVTKIEGIVGYWGGAISEYTIIVQIPGTKDDKIVGIITDMPSDFKIEGMEVIFSGKYAQTNTLLDPIPEISLYDLTLSSIKRK
jgi:hypothetical protein